MVEIFRRKKIYECVKNPHVSTENSGMSWGSSRAEMVLVFIVNPCRLTLPKGVGKVAVTGIMQFALQCVGAKMGLKEF